MAITASQVKTLRERTGAGMLDCKKALTEAGGDLDAAAQALRAKGIAAAEKKAGRIAAEGVIACASGAAGAALVEVNCETDFVAKDASFQDFAAAVAEAILAAPEAPAAGDLDAAGALPLGDATVDTARRELIGKIGENIALRRFARLEAGGGVLSTYMHGARIGVLVQLGGGGDGDGGALGRDIAMHIAATRPLCIGDADVPADTLAREEAIFTAQAATSGKPPEIAQKMVAGRMKKFLKENTLLGQAFVKNPDQTVAQLVKAAGATVEKMVRFEVGEGLEKRQDDFVAEVQSAART